MKSNISKQLAVGSSILSLVLTVGVGSVFAQTATTSGMTNGGGQTVLPTTGTMYTSGTSSTTGTSGTSSIPAGTTNSSSGTSIPGVPNTGAGGDQTANVVALLISALVALAGGAYLARSQKA